MKTFPIPFIDFRSLTTAMVLFAAIGQADASLVVSFEESEGFQNGTRNKQAGSPAAAWTLPNDSRALVTDAEAFEGDLSLRLDAASPVITASLMNLSADEGYAHASWSFTNPTATFGNSVSVTLVYIFFYDKTLQSNRLLRYLVSYGASEGTSRLSYDVVNADGSKTNYGGVYNNPDGLFNSWSEWNTISVDLSADRGSYSILINGQQVEPLSNLGLGNWDVEAINGIWLVSPGVGSTYYDAITFAAVPEPSLTALMGIGFFGTGLLWAARRRNGGLAA